MNYKYQIESETAGYHEKIIQCLYALGYKNSDTSVISAVEYWKKYGFAYPWTIIAVDSKIFSGNTRVYDEHKTITFDKFLSLKEELIIEVKLNEVYTAEVSNNGIKVGCTTFPLEIVNKLVKAIKTIGYSPK